MHSLFYKLKVIVYKVGFVRRFCTQNLDEHERRQYVCVCVCVWWGESDSSVNTDVNYY